MATKKPETEVVEKAVELADATAVINAASQAALRAGNQGAHAYLEGVLSSMHALKSALAAPYPFDGELADTLASLKAIL